jgi:hypothetical protein
LQTTSKTTSKTQIVCNYTFLRLNSYYAKGAVIYLQAGRAVRGHTQFTYTSGNDDKDVLGFGHSAFIISPYSTHIKEDDDLE